MTNPYKKFIGEREPDAVLAETVQRLKALIRGIDVEQPIAEGKWSVREIVAHLADCEIAHSFRLRQALAEPGHTVQPFDQDKWAKQYAAYDAESAMECFAALRAWNLRLLAGMPEEARGIAMNHPERGDMTVQTLIETMAGHDVNHLIQIEAFVERVK